ncbi:MAG: LytTR family DNA-binding domain-containing protein, partial [Lachnospiraceae bacterium]|nr:LytTR family DNA-binding domain-containing protein [Lachnospiraceae bacterium]
CLLEKYEQMNEQDEKQRLIIQIRGERIFLMQSEIQYMERSERKTYIYSYDCGQERVIATSQKINELSKKLDSRIFMRCHNSYIVNINFISKMYREHFVLKNGKSIPISRRYSKKIRERF